jgi:hypothetical protein
MSSACCSTPSAPLIPSLFQHGPLDGIIVTTHYGGKKVAHLVYGSDGQL